MYMCVRMCVCNKVDTQEFEKNQKLLYRKINGKLRNTKVHEILFYRHE